MHITSGTSTGSPSAPCSGPKTIRCARRLMYRSMASGAARLQKRPDLNTEHVWKDFDQAEETAKPMTFWLRARADRARAMSSLRIAAAQYDIVSSRPGRAMRRS